MNRYIRSALRRINTLPIRSKRKELIGKYGALHEIFLDYMNSFHADGGFNYNKQDIKVLQLLDLLVKKQPKRLVEYGTGSTSLACAYYATNYNASYLGLDESPIWAKTNNERLSKFIPNLKNAEIRQSDRVDDYSDEIYFTHLKYDPEEHFDFMLIDGPSFALNEKHTNKVNTDITKYYSVGLPETIIVDNRKETVRWLKLKIGAEYTIQDSLNWTVQKRIQVTKDFLYYTLMDKIK